MTQAGHYPPRPSLNWLRDVALAVRSAGHLDTWLRTNRLVDILTLAVEVELPGLDQDADVEQEEVRKKVLQAIGRRLSKCFETGNTLAVDGFEIERRELDDPVQRRLNREYCFRLANSETHRCAYAPVAHRGSIGANQAQSASQRVPVDFAKQTPGNGKAVCAYGAPIAAPKAAPMNSAAAPIAPMGSEQGTYADKITRLAVNSGVQNVFSKESMQPLGAIGALGALLDSQPCEFFSPSASTSPMRGAHWVTIHGSRSLPECVRELVSLRVGWTAPAWYDRLLQMARLCAEVNPERAAELRLAAGLMIDKEPGSSDSTLTIRTP